MSKFEIIFTVLISLASVATAASLGIFIRTCIQEEKRKGTRTPTQSDKKSQLNISQ